MKRYLRFILLVFLILLLICNIQVLANEDKSDVRPFVDLDKITPGLYLWSSYFISRDFDEIMKEWRLESLLTKEALKIKELKYNQETWINRNHEEAQKVVLEGRAEEWLKSAISINFMPFFFKSKKEALIGANLILKSPITGYLTPGSFSGRPIGDLVWSSKKEDSTPDYSRPLEILFVKGDVVAYLWISRHPLSRKEEPLDIYWAEDLAKGISGYIW